MEKEYIYLNKIIRQIRKKNHKNLKIIEFSLKDKFFLFNLLNKLCNFKNFLNDLDIINNLMINIKENNNIYKKEKVLINDELVEVYSIKNFDVEILMKLFYTKIDLNKNNYIVKENYNIKSNIEKYVKYLIRFINIKIIFYLSKSEIIAARKYGIYLNKIISKYKNYDNEFLNLDIMRSFLTLNLIYIKENNSFKIKEWYNRFFIFYRIHLSYTKNFKKNENKKKSYKNLKKSYKFCILLHYQLLFYYKWKKNLEMFLNCFNIIKDLYNIYFSKENNSILIIINNLKNFIEKFSFVEFQSKHSYLINIINMFNYININNTKVNSNNKKELNYYFDNFENKFDFEKYNIYNKKLNFLNNTKTEKNNKISLSKLNSGFNFNYSKNKNKNYLSTQITQSSKSQKNINNDLHKNLFLKNNKEKKSYKNLFKNLDGNNGYKLVNKNLFKSFKNYSNDKKNKINFLKSNNNYNLEFKGDDIKFLPKKKNIIKKESEINKYYSNLVHNNIIKEKKIIDIEEIKYKKLVRKDDEIFEKRDFLSCIKILNNKKKIIKNNVNYLIDTDVNFKNKLKKNTKIDKIKDLYKKKEFINDNLKDKENQKKKFNNQSWKDIMIKNKNVFKINNFVKKNKKGFINIKLEKYEYDKESELKKLNLVN